MADKQDKFQMLKSKYLEQVREKERELAGLRSKLQLIQELEQESESLNEASPANGKYRELGLTESVLDAIQSIGASNGVSATDVAKYLVSQGFQPKGKNFKVSVGSTLKRLVDPQQQIITELKDGQRLYRSK